MGTTTADDAWLRELLLSGDWLSELRDADQMAAVLAARDPAVDHSGGATRVLLSAVAEAWERGWQPADVVHPVRRQAASRPARLAVALIAEDARRSDAASRAPGVWVDQLRELDALSPGDRAVVAAWHRAEGRPAVEAWRGVLLLATALRSLARIDHLVPPPSRWDAAAPRADAVPAADDARLLRRIRGLLAKAESTEFPEEAEALTAKAAELMARHSVDAVLLAGGGTTPDRAAVGTRRVHVDAPYVRAKMQLLGAVADANGVRLVWYRSLGIANLVGVPADLDAVELLFTSLLLQVSQALAAAERAAGRRSASRSFRRAFLLGYAIRIGERLQSARERATATAAAERGVDLLPVLRSRQEAVDDVFAELFPRVRGSRGKSPVDPTGWHAGRAAAERADVGSRREPLR
ncbi:DUF2786 domain-containing protein [Geodermatophilus ruber]|nr:DUF2786 domain-containing protein [Geodermatophilus ruber]